MGEGPLYNRVFFFFCEVFIVKVLFTLSTYGLNFDLTELVFTTKIIVITFFVVPLMIICVYHFLGISICQGSDQMVVIEIKEEALLSFTIRVMKLLKYRDDRRSPPVFVFVFLNFPFYSYHDVSFLN